MVSGIDFIDLGYLVASALFIFGLKNLGHPRTAPRGNLYGALGMLMAILTTMAKFFARRESIRRPPRWCADRRRLGCRCPCRLSHGRRVEMTGMPELVALFNGFGGAASALVALSEALRRLDEQTYGGDEFTRWVLYLAIGASSLVGWMTLTGSILAMYKLKGGVELFGKWFRTPTWGPSWLNIVKGLLLVGTVALIVLGAADPSQSLYVWAVVATSSILGIILVLPIGGADMPVVVSLLNSLSGIAHCLHWIHHPESRSHHRWKPRWCEWPDPHVHHVQSDES